MTRAFARAEIKDVHCCTSQGGYCLGGISGEGGWGGGLCPDTAV